MTWLTNTPMYRADVVRVSQRRESLLVGVGSSWDWSFAFWQQLWMTQSQASAEENIIKGAFSSKLLWAENANNVSLTSVNNKAEDS